ncbi:MAG: peptidoglycan editing factor PgeF [bacterium]
MITPDVLHAKVLDLPRTHHGFTSRRGGVSQGSFAGLNLSPKWFEDAGAVQENYRLLAEHAGYDAERLYIAHQVHGRRGVIVEGQPVADVRQQEADFLVTAQSGVTVAVITADCVPVLLADRAQTAVAAVHAGWRGLVGGVIQEAVAALRDRFGVDPTTLVAALGPGIGACCFEVGPEVVRQFETAFPDVEGIVRPGRIGELGGDAKPHVDLWKGARLALERAGLQPDRIEDPPACTMCEPERFYSFRRDGGRIGQHLSFIGIAG